MYQDKTLFYSYYLVIIIKLIILFTKSKNKNAENITLILNIIEQ